MLRVERQGLAVRMVTLSHHVTWLLGTRLPRAVPLVFVVGYPKTGTTWASQLVADYLQLPYPQMSLLPVGFAAVVHGHELIRDRYPYCVYMMRDGRDAIVSHYFHLARMVPEGDHPRMSRFLRKHLPGLVNRNDIRRNLAPFIEQQMKRPAGSRHNWAEHTRSCLESNHSRLGVLRYEGMLNDPAAELTQALTRLTGDEPDPNRVAATIEKLAFSKQAGRAAGREDRSSFLRKGTSGDWTNHFTREAAEIFDRHCGDVLIEAGYETDRSWAQQID